ncbi:MAG: amidase family protein [Pseudomonadota bacterium]
MSSAPLCDRPAVDLRQMIGAKQISPRELLADCQARIAEVNPTLNAVVAEDGRAAAAAEAAEAAVLRGEDLGLLHGLPIGIKDLSETEGLTTTFGSPLYADYVPKADDPLVTRLRQAGAIIAAKTNTPEFGAGANTTNAVYGVTGNPFDPALTCAGSSGGSAVAMATSMLPLCTGSDLGGSLRTPAAYCGIFGLRPTPGLVPDPAGLRIFSPLSVEGPMARSLPDLRLLLQVLAGHDRRCPLSRPFDPAALSAPPADLSSMTVGFSEDLGIAPVSEEVRGLFRQRVEALSPLFGQTDNVSPPLEDATWVFETLRAVGFLAGFATLYQKDPQQLGPNVRVNTALGFERSAADVAAAQVAHGKLYRAFLGLMDQVDVLICPVASVQPFDKTKLYPDQIDGKPLQTYISWIAITYAITLTGCPSLVLPCGLDEKGLPFGLQIVGKPWQEAKLLAFGESLEALLASDPRYCRPIPDLKALAG